MIFVFLGLLNGGCITLSRVLNGQLSAKQGMFYASLLNHLIGFAFLSFLLLVFIEPLHIDVQSPLLFTGGAIGAVYVAINSFVMTRLGTTKAIVMVVSGQMLFGLVMNVIDNGVEELALEMIGALLVVAGAIIKGR